jgi:hypothetical protein
VASHSVPIPRSCFSACLLGDDCDLERDRKLRRRDAKVPSAKIILPLSLQSVTWGPDQKFVAGPLIEMTKNKMAFLGQPLDVGLEPLATEASH